MLHGASTTPLMAELTLLGLGIPRQNPNIRARSATRPTLAPDGLAQICCNLCTAVQWFVGLQQYIHTMFKRVCFFLTAIDWQDQDLLQELFF